jgi:parvulin-like peptidyl-prolyl isomerase
LTQACLLLICLGQLLLLTACKQEDKGNVLARVGSHQITREDFRNEIARRLTIHRPIPDKETLLQEMIGYEALLQRAKSSGIADEPAIKREINNLLIAKFQDRDLTPKLDAIKISPDDLKAEYEKNLAKFTKPAKARLAILHLQTNGKTSDAKRSELRQRMEEARQKAGELHFPAKGDPNGSGFGTLALDYSDDQASRYRGGDIGWLDAGKFSYRWPHAVLEAGYSLPTGQISELIEDSSGFYLVMKTDFREGSTRPLSAVEAQVRQELLVNKRHDLEENYRSETLRLASASINKQALASVEIAPPPIALAQNRDTAPPAMPIANESSNGK